ncbi:MAG: CHAT domain-containing protein [Cyanobacteria bacterium P01_F01_bin.86]
MRKILILAANPKDVTRRRLDEEARDIREGLERAKKRDEFEIVQRWAVRPRDLQRAMLDESPQIVHFTGHSDGAAGLVFEDEAGNAQLVTADALAKLFKLFKQDCDCVVLNGCYSLEQAAAIAEHIPYVIGMHRRWMSGRQLSLRWGFTMRWAVAGRWSLPLSLVKRRWSCKGQGARICLCCGRMRLRRWRGRQSRRLA